MIANRIRNGHLQSRPDPRILAHQASALLTYVVNADPTMMIAAARLERFASYALDAELKARGVQTGEKVIAHGCLNLDGNDIAAWNAQMISTAVQCPRSKHPLEHIVLSWQPDEKPTAKELAEAVSLMADTLGCARNQIVWAAHGNTENIHVHMVVNRIDPETFTATQLGDGWDLDRLAQGCAIIEARQGWKPEGNTPYSATEQGEVRAVKNGKVIRTKDGVQTRKKGDRASDLKAWREQPIFAAITDALQAATDWQMLHRELAKLDATFIKKGTGAVIVVQHDAFKASRFGRDCSMTALIDRLNDFQEPLVQSSSLRGHSLHKSKLADLEADLRESEKSAMLKLHQRHAVSINSTRLRAQSEDERLAKTTNLERLIKAARKAIRREYQTSLHQVRAARVAETDWALGSRGTVPIIKRPTILFPDVEPEHLPELMGNYQTRKGLGVTEYRRHNSNDLLFSDYHVCIVVHVSNDADVTAALRLAANRWEVVDITGSKQFQEQCARIADELGIEVSGRHIQNGQKVDGHPKAAKRSETMPLPDFGIAPRSRPILPTPIGTATQNGSIDAAVVPKSSVLTDPRLENATSIKLMVGQPSAVTIKNSSGSNGRFGHGNAVISTPSPNHGIKVEPETARLAIIYKFFHAAHWLKSEYPESSSNDVATLDHSGLHAGYPKSSNDITINNKSPFSTTQMQAARAASTSLGIAG